MFEAALPEMMVGSDTAEFSKIYAERQGILQALEKFRESNPTTSKLAHELTDPEVKEFVEFIHTSYELGVEEKLEHVVMAMQPEHFDLFSKFVRVMSSNPNFFDLNQMGHLITNAS